MTCLPEPTFRLLDARVGWDRAGDVVDVQLVRSPGINGAKSTIV